MKKVLSLILALSLLLACAAFAGAEDSIIGKWQVASDDIAVMMGASAAEIPEGFGMYLEFRNDGVMVISETYMGQEASMNSTWQSTGSHKVNLEMSGISYDMIWYFEDGALVLDDGELPVHLYSVNGAAANVPAAAAAAAQGVEGKWKLSDETLLASLGAANAEEYAYLLDLITYTMDFRNDGTMIMSVIMLGQEETYTDEWHYTGENSIYMTIQGDPSNAVFWFENGNLILDDGISALVLEPVETASSSVPAISGFTTPTLTATTDLSGKWDGREFYNYMLKIAAEAGQDYTSMQSLFDMMTFTLNLNADGTATLDVDAFGTSQTENLNNWLVSGSTFIISGVSFTFTLTGDTLTLTDALGDTFSMTRIY